MWSVTSGAQDLKVIKAFMGSHAAQDRVKLTMKCRYAVDIAPFSAIPKESECILAPGAQFEVLQSAILVDKTAISGEYGEVILQEIEDTFGDMLA